MSDELTLNDLHFILESLEFTRMKFENYAGYPSYEFKRERMREVDEVMAHVRAYRDRLNANGK